MTHGVGATVTTDLEISAVIAGTYVNGETALTKEGNGRLELSAESTYAPGLTQIDVGDVQVDSLQEQTLTLPSSVLLGDSFTLTYNDPSADSSSPVVTASIVAQGTGNDAGTATNIENALNQALVGSNTGPVTVSVIGSGVFSIALPACSASTSSRWS